MQIKTKEASTSINIVIRSISLLMLAYFPLSDIYYHGFTDRSIVCMSAMFLMLMCFVIDEVFQSSFNWFGWSFVPIISFAMYAALIPVVTSTALFWLLGTVLASMFVLKFEL